MYYGLTNYYQNHRRYVKSRDDEQLLGRLSVMPSSDCTPFGYTDDGKPIAPCGAIANSLFNGKEHLTYKIVPFTPTYIDNSQNRHIDTEPRQLEYQFTQHGYRMAIGQAGEVPQSGESYASTEVLWL